MTIIVYTVIVSTMMTINVYTVILSTIMTTFYKYNDFV